MLRDRVVSITYEQYRDWPRPNSTRIFLHDFVFDSTSYFKFILKYYAIYTLNFIYNSIVQYTFLSTACNSFKRAIV